MGLHSVMGGKGTIGAEVVRHLAAAGRQVRVVQRHPGPLAGAVATASADVFDLDGPTRAVEGSEVVHLLLRMVGLVDGAGRGLLERSYPFEQDDRFDSSEIARAGGLTATPMRQGLAEHLRFLGHALAAEAPLPAGGLGRPGTSR